MREVIRRSGIPYREDDPTDHSFHNINPAQLKDGVENASLKFIFMRHPMEWYASYWNHRHHVGWEGELHPGWNAVRIYQARGADTFPEFLEQVLATGTPFISQHQALFLQMESIGRLEDLRNELCRIFEAAGEAVDSALVHGLAAQNVIPYRQPGRIRLPKSLYDRMVELEGWAFEFFAYPMLSDRFELT